MRTQEYVTKVVEKENSCILYPDLKECQGCEYHKSETLGSMGIIEGSNTFVDWCSFLNLPIENDEKS
jgi:hypothetical protein